jgi:hypothetical protein
VLVWGYTAMVEIEDLEEESKDAPSTRDIASTLSRVGESDRIGKVPVCAYPGPPRHFLVLPQLPTGACVSLGTTSVIPAACRARCMCV